MSADPDSAGATPAPSTLAGLILAAGESSRMGTDKALLKYQGRTFLETILATLQGVGIERIVVVLGHHAEEIRQSIDLAAVEVVVNLDYRLGQTTSLQTGLRALAENEPDAVMMCLVDHPAFVRDTALQLIHRFKSTGRPVIIPEIHGKHGHPILVGRELFNELRALGPQAGANSVIHRHRNRTEFVAVTDPGILLDVDDPETYNQLTSQV